MTGIYIGAILVQLGVIIYFVASGRGKAAPVQPVKQVSPDSFDGQRAMALTVTPSDLKLAIPDTQHLVYGVVVDWNMGDYMVCLAAYITGAANLHLSTGGGMTGAGKKPNVGEATVALVTSAQHFIPRAVPGTAHDLPPAGCVRFYLLTNKQTYMAQEQVIYFDDQTSPWLVLFEKANEVIAEMKN